MNSPTVSAPPAPVYGSDQDGLVWGYVFLPSEPPRPVECPSARQYLDEFAEDSGRDGFVWLHFSLSNAASERWLRTALTLPDSFYDALHGNTGSTRLEIDDGRLIAVIHDVLVDNVFDASKVSTVTLCLSRRLVVSARLKPLRSVDQLRAAVKGGYALRSSAGLLAHLLRDQADVLGDIARQATARVDEIEDTLLDERLSMTRSELSAMRRGQVRLQRLLAPETAAMFRLLNRSPDWLDEADVADLRQAAEEFSASVLDSGALTERLKLLQEELVATVNEHTNRTLFILTVVTVLALPINVVAGLFGMNVGGLPLAQHPHGFSLVVAMLTAVTVGLSWFLLLRRREQ
ncbi:MAG TPA: transporter [Steroidobacteraceae bacterium]|nr:transporter [Steroidobacteraceae bacterium]